MDTHLPQRPGATWSATLRTHWAYGMVIYPAVFLGTALQGSILKWVFADGLGVRFFKWFAQRATVPAWMYTLFVLGILVDDMGTGIGMQGKEIPRTMVEGNQLVINWSHKAQEWGLFRNHTDVFRWQVATGLLTLWAAWKGWIPLNNFAKWMVFFTAPFMKMYAGYQWWGVPNDFTVVDFLTLREGRDCWERSSKAAAALFNQGGSKAQYAQSPDATEPLEHTLDARRRLVQGSKTFRVMNDLGWLSILFPII